MVTIGKNNSAEDPVVGRYVNILLEDWFKRTFGQVERKRLLILVLRELIPERDIEDIVFTPQEHVNPFEGKRDVCVDVECIEAGTGARFVVEMQLAPQEHFAERALFNSTFAIQEQKNKGEKDYDFPPVYFIGLMDFSLHRGAEQVLYRYRLREDVTGEVMSDRVNYLFLELPNCSRARMPGASTLEKLCFALHNMHRLKEKPPGMDGELFTLLFDCAEFTKLAPKEQIRYRHDMTTARDIANQIDYARKEGMSMGMLKGMEKGMKKGVLRGRKEGREEGRQEGMEKERMSIAEKLRGMGIPLESIAQATGLSVEELKGMAAK